MHRYSASYIHGAKLQFQTAKSHRVFMTATLPSSSKEVEEVKKPFSPRKSDGRVTHSTAPEKMEIFKSLENWAESNVLVNLKPVERALEIPDEYYVCLAGDMITEKALPTYQSLLNSTDGVRDETGASSSPWAVWTRGWTAEENRHGDLLNKYVYLSGRVDMRQIEKTTQYLIGSGMSIFIMLSGQYNLCDSRLGVYTASDYADMLEFFVKRWNVEKLGGLSSEWRKAQEYVRKLAPRIRRLEERAQEMSKGGQSCPFSWIFNTEVALI
eukprot:Gb_23796 [translate_table: standard]